MRTFKHSGDLGDIIYSLPAVKELGGGILYLNPNNSFTKFNTKGYEFIRPLLISQDYIHDVKIYTGKELIDFDFDKFRTSGYDLANTNLARLHARTFNLDEDIINNKWLSSRHKKIKNKKIVINRSARYHNKYDWQSLLDKHKGDILFVGLKEEYDCFVKEFNADIDFYQVKDAYELAEVINGAKLFVGNQSLAFAISEGLHKANLLEVCSFCPNCCFLRKGHNMESQVVEIDLDETRCCVYTENGFIITSIENSPCYECLSKGLEKEYEDYHYLVKTKYNADDEHSLENFKELYNVIKETGYKDEPLIEVKKTMKYYEITDGQHRASILKHLGINKVRAIITEWGQ